MVSARGERPSLRGDSEAVFIFVEVDGDLFKQGSGERIEHKVQAVHLYRFIMVT